MKHFLHVVVAQKIRNLKYGNGFQTKAAIPYNCQTCIYVRTIVITPVVIQPQLRGRVILC